MTKPTTVHVTAAEGRLCPIAMSDATAPGGRLLLVEPGTVHELPNSSYVRRRILAGDLIVVEPPRASAPASSAPKRKADTQPATTKEEG